jgi:hypothetical protein
MPNIQIIKQLNHGSLTKIFVDPGVRYWVLGGIANSNSTVSYDSTWSSIY